MASIRGMVEAVMVGTMGYFIMGFIMNLITGTDTVTTFFKQIVPVVFAFGVAWVMLSRAFKANQ